MMEESEKFNLNDILYPKLEWQNGACYRVNRKAQEFEPKPKLSPIKAYDDNEDVKCDDIPDFDIEVTENGRFKTHIRMPHAFYSYIIGTKGSRRKKLEEETKTEITIPKKYRNNKIIITGPTENNVSSARRKIEMIGHELRNKHEITHFISFPLITDEIKENFKIFKNAIVTGGHIDGVDESIFQKVDKIHLTIGTLVLLDNSEIDEASDVLERCKKEIIDPQLKSGLPLIIKMKDLEYMNDDPSHVDVLFAKVSVENHQNPNILQKISNDIVEFFYKNGLMKREYDHVKLHATLMNTRYRKENDSSSSTSRDQNKRSNRKRIAFDARPIMDKFANFDFGQQQLNSIHLSHRFSVDEKGYYESEYAISCI